ncbi:CPBP family intramembrane glutamic endopeptidase [Arcanobacterium buesumense]|uniref:CPBP family intramembrane metalloprotease n=1 Tax=Arcanobacterium buesumense TaxID=2722751 RepID=A0A6H2EMU0_9ACTO|nr:type II CAAX endopeptidase family protein [Arcanobacterium buesumense]QJC22389.1 CPBP family intramembrane metalloprotease [Arcanobacterium buesumense]
MNDVSLGQPSSGPMLPWRPILVFFAAMLFHSLWLIAFQLWLDVSLDYIAFPQLGPTLGLATTWLLYRSWLTPFLPVAPTSVGEFRRRSRIVVVACLGYVFATWVLAEMLQAGSYRALFTDWHLVGFLTVQFLGAVVEEIGWRGFLQPLFVKRFGAILGASLVGVIWAAWHGDQLLDPLGFIVFALTCVALSLVLEMMVAGSWWQRGLLAAGLHWAVNIAPVVVINVDDDAVPNLVTVLVILIPQCVFGLVAFVILVKRYGWPRLGKLKK